MRSCKTLIRSPFTEAIHGALPILVAATNPASLCARKR